MNSIIDWDLSIKLAGNNESAAKEILIFLIKDLPTDLNQIKHLFVKNQYTELTKLVHRLHGALCYCGVPRLKEATQALETALKKNNTSEISKLFIIFENEVNQLLMAAPKALMAIAF
jgi:two-component system sensor histidine kinase BarA